MNLKNNDESFMINTGEGYIKKHTRTVLFYFMVNLLHIIAHFVLDYRHKLTCQTPQQMV